MLYKIENNFKTLRTRKQHISLILSKIITNNTYLLDILQFL